MKRLRSYVVISTYCGTLRAFQPELKRLAPDLHTLQTLRDKRKLQKAFIETEEPHTGTPHELCRTNRCPTECRECTSDGDHHLPDIVIPVCHATNSTTNAPKQPVARSVHFDDTPLVIPLGLITSTVTEFAPAQTVRNGPNNSLHQRIH